MKKTEVGKNYAVLIGDIVSSRSFQNQDDLLNLVIQTLEWVNERTSPVQPFSMTVGDEFQGAYSDLGQAFDAALYLQLRLLGRVEFRFGCGWGAISRFDPGSAPMAQSGSAWWVAREALEEVVELNSKKLWPRTIRTRFRLETSEGDRHPMERLVNSFLLCRDALLASLDERDGRIALGLFFDERQDELAKELAISQPAVAKRLTEKGLSTLFRAHRGLQDLVP